MCYWKSSWLIRSEFTLPAGGLTPVYGESDTMRKLALLLAPALLLTLMGFTARPCHSEQFRIAKRKLDRLILTSVQRDAVRSFEQRFQREWNHTHRAQGCSHHEDHARQFIAAAAGVLDDAQFEKFQSRGRTSLESLGHKIWESRLYAQDLQKLARAL